MAGSFEVGFGVDKFGKPLVHSGPESLLQIVHMLFLSKPGNYPSNPEIGLDIASRLLFMTEDSLELEELQRDITAQLTTFLDKDSFGEIILDYQNVDGSPVVVIKVPLLDGSGRSNNVDEIVAGFTINPKDQELIHQIMYQSSK